MDVNTTPPRWLKGVALILIVWALAGVAAFVAQVSMSAEDAAQLPREQQEMWANMPAWAWAAYAVAVFAGLAGAISLWLRWRWAVLLYPASLIAVLVQFSYPFVIANGLQTLGGGALVFPAFIIFMAAFQSWLARDWSAKGWLK